MNDLQAILKAFQVISQCGETAFLVTVVNTQGSTYRRAGARMLITQTGETIGMVSGGCLEQDILEHTRMQLDKAIVVTYDSTSEHEDILWDFGLGCNGIVQVLIESLPPDSYHPLTILAECWRERCPAVLASIFQIEGQIEGVGLGACLALTPNKLSVFEQTHSDLVTKIGADAQAVLHQQQSTTKSYDLATGKVQVFLEFMPSPTSLMIFGAGQDAIPVAQLAKSVGWQVTVIDCRANLISHERFVMADQVLLTGRERLSQLNMNHLIDQPSAAVVMTHNYLDDLKVLKMLLPSSISYIGVLGPKRRTERLLQDLQTEGMVYSNVQLEKLYAPIGLDIGADTPEAIAVSIVAEIQSVLTQRTSGFLKHRSMPIH